MESAHDSARAQAPNTQVEPAFGPAEQLAKVNAMAVEHLQEAAKELLEWHETSVLRDGRILEMATLLRGFGSNALTLAERAVEHAAIRHAATVPAPARDPRIDPIAGDVIEFTTGPSTGRHEVISVVDGMVFYRDEGLEDRVPLVRWRAWYTSRDVRVTPAPAAR